MVFMGPGFKMSRSLWLFVQSIEVQWGPAEGHYEGNRLGSRVESYLQVVWGYQTGQVEQDQQLKSVGGCGGILGNTNHLVSSVLTVPWSLLAIFCFGLVFKVLFICLYGYLFVYIVIYLILGISGVFTAGCFVLFSWDVSPELFSTSHLPVLTGMHWDKQVADSEQGPVLTHSLRTSHEGHAIIFCGELWP